MNPLNYCVVLAVDDHYFRHWQWTIKTWKKFRPQLFAKTWIVYCDRDAGVATPDAIRNLLASHGVARVITRRWPPNGVSYSSQREKMLAAFVWGPTGHDSDDNEFEWWMKLDCDALAEGPCETWEPHHHMTGEEAFLACPWSYSLEPQNLGKLEDWGDKHEHVKKFPRLGLEIIPGNKTVRHKRFCSWVSWNRSSFTREVCGLFKPFEMLIPSQDTIHHYLCERLRQTWTPYAAKKMSWSTIRNPGRSEARVREILQITD